ncbi:MAG: 7-carboxy-7-deazaguanine synthase QueE [Kiritimatiellia bacterium]
MSGRYRLHAIFSSLQGEGRNVGRPATFIRFSTCNLACAWCDTHKSERMMLTSCDILRQVAELGNKSVIVTGGEPTIQPGLDDLLLELRNAGHWIALETNGVVAPTHPDLFDYIAVSPKPQYLSRYLDDTMLHRANEVRIVATTDEIAPFCRAMRERIQADDYYISPLEQEGRIHYHRALKLLRKVNLLDPGRLPPWSLSIQMHKVIGIR